MGLNDRDTKTQKINEIEAYKVTTNILTSLKIEGATIFSAHGFYTHQDGTLTIENTLRIELLFVDKTKVLTVIEKLKETFNQESIALQEENIVSELI